MRPFQKQNVAKSLAVVGILAFFFLGFLGFGHFGMTGPGWQSSTCPFMGIAAFCRMNPLEFTLLLGLLIALVPSFAIQNLRLIKKKLLLYRTHLPVILTPLKAAFSDGILHPKIY